MSRQSATRTVAVDVDATTKSPSRRLTGPWYLIALLGAWAVLVAGWLLLAGPVALGWLTSPGVDFGAALGIATQLLVLAHGAPVQVGTQVVSIAPLGLTAALIVLGQPVVAVAARAAAAKEAQVDDTGQLWVNAERLVLRVTGGYVASYTVGVAALAASELRDWNLLRAVLGAAAVATVSGFWGASQALGFDPRRPWPAWLRALPEALGAALLTCLVGGAIALTWALWLGRDRIAAISDGLDPGVSGVILLIVLQVLYLPNLILWATGWVLGGSVTFGDGSVLSMAISDVGFLPAIPVLGAVPGTGIGPSLGYWWLSVGVLAGLVAGASIAAARPRARFDETALVGGVAGALAGLTVALAAAVSNGSLGQGRLANVGIQQTDLVIVAPALLGLAGLLGGLLTGLLRRPQLSQQDVE